MRWQASSPARSLMSIGSWTTRPDTRVCLCVRKSITLTDGAPNALSNGSSCGKRPRRPPSRGIFSKDLRGGLPTTCRPRAPQPRGAASMRRLPLGLQSICSRARYCGLIWRHGGMRRMRKKPLWPPPIERSCAGPSERERRSRTLGWKRQWPRRARERGRRSFPTCRRRCFTRIWLPRGRPTISTRKMKRKSSVRKTARGWPPWRRASKKPRPPSCFPNRRWPTAWRRERPSTNAFSYAATTGISASR